MRARWLRADGRDGPARRLQCAGRAGPQRRRRDAAGAAAQPQPAGPETGRPSREQAQRRRLLPPRPTDRRTPLLYGTMADLQATTPCSESPSTTRRPRRTRAAHTRRRAPDRTGGRRPPRPARARAIARGARPVGATRRGAGRLGPRLKALLRVAVHAREGELLFRFVRRGRPPDLLLRWRVGRRACTTGSLAAISLFAAAFGMRTRGQGAIFVPLDVNTSAEQCHRNRRTDLHHPLPSPLHLLARLPPPAFMRNRNCSDLRSGQRLERSRDNQVMLRASKRRSLGMLGYRKYSNVVS